MSEPETPAERAAGSTPFGTEDEKKSQAEGADGLAPNGSASRRSRWLLALSAVAWLGWVAFLIAMAMSRMTTPTV